MTEVLADDTSGCDGVPAVVHSGMMAPCIMLVDDEPLVSEVLRLHLEDNGYRHFEITDDPTAATSLAVENQPDLMLLDLMMPEMNGFDVLGQLRSDERTRHLPVIVLTSASDPQARLKALELGATDFLSKPVDPSELSLRVRNILTMKAYQDRLAFFDRITDLPNRRRFLDLLSRAVAPARGAGEPCAVIQIGLDRFEQVNDALGYSAGDSVLRDIAGRLSRELEKVTGDPDTVTREGVSIARTGGDEFSVLLPGMHEEQVVAVAERLLACITETLWVRGDSIHLSASAGIAMAPQHGESVDTLLGSASQALSYMKRRGGAGVEVFGDEVDSWSRDRVRLESDLRKALDEGALSLVFQPKADVRSGRVLGAEALVRWHHPQRGFVSPSEFVPVAEDTGLVVPMGTWVLREACRQAAAWHRACSQGFSIAVNVSPRQFQEKDLYETVEAAIADSGLPAACLTLELTEGLLIQDSEQTVRTLVALGELGVRISVDDFGTGYSALAYLSRLPVSELKIDRSFLRRVPENADDVAIVKAVIAMGRSLSLSVVAEGVETQAQLALLSGCGCDVYQGFLISEPLEAEEFVGLLSLRASTPMLEALDVG